MMPEPSMRHTQFSNSLFIVFTIFKSESLFHLIIRNIISAVKRNGNPNINNTNEYLVLSFFSSAVSILLFALDRSPLINAPENIPAISHDIIPIPPIISTTTSPSINNPTSKAKLTLRNRLIIKVLILITPR
jgi:hypothetical protein